MCEGKERWAARPAMDVAGSAQELFSVCGARTRSSLKNKRFPTVRPNLRTHAQEDEIAPDGEPD
jgi:hypothetical protein